MHSAARTILLLAVVAGLPGCFVTRPLGLGPDPGPNEVAPDDTPAIATGMAPFATSSKKHTSPSRRPRTRPTLVAPTFLEPCSRMSMPRKRPIRNPKGIDPMTYAAGIQIIHTNIGAPVLWRFFAPSQDPMISVRMSDRCRPAAPTRLSGASVWKEAGDKRTEFCILGKEAGRNCSRLLGLC